MRRMVWPVALLVLLGASCGGDDVSIDGVDVETGDGTVSIEVEDGDGSGTIVIESEDSNGSQGSIVIESDEGTAVIGGGNVSEGFPLPLWDFEIVASSSVQTDEGSFEQVTVEFPADRFDTVCDDYEAALDDLGLDVSRTSIDQGSEGRMVMLIGESDSASAVINVLLDGSADTGNASIAWSETG